MDEDEADVDCGGTLCAACADGNACTAAADCVSARCDANVCSSCTDGVQSGPEDGIDCGPTCSLACHCTNNTLDADETGIDCGGADCNSCPLRKKITISGDDATGAKGAHIDFPVLVRLTGADFVEIEDDVDANGYDLRFTSDAAGTVDLPFERERYDETSDELVAWVKMTVQDAGQDFYIHYAENDLTEKSTPASVWSNAYQHVWHLDTAPTGTNVDVTGNGGNATGVNMESGDLVGGVIGDGIVFDGSNERLTYTNGFAGSGPSTISAWVNQTNDGDNNSIISFGTPGSNQVRYLFSTHDATSTIRVGFNPNSVNTDDGIEGLGWKHVTWVWNAGNTEVFLDGTSVYGPVAHTGANTTGTGGRIGANVLDNVFLDGALDEVRVSTSVRSADWITAEYNNQRPSSSFIMVGAQENL
jgi:hypothetical protein